MSPSAIYNDVPLESIHHDGQLRGNPVGAPWIIQKFGGTSLGKFAEDIASGVVKFVSASLIYNIAANYTEQTEHRNLPHSHRLFRTQHRHQSRGHNLSTPPRGCRSPKPRALHLPHPNRPRNNARPSRGRKVFPQLPGPPSRVHGGRGSGVRPPPLLPLRRPGPRRDLAKNSRCYHRCRREAELSLHDRPAAG